MKNAILALLTGLMAAPAAYAANHLSVAFLNPSHVYQKVDNSTILSASVSGSVGVSSVTYYLDGALIGAASWAPYPVRLNTRAASGNHTLSVKAVDSLGHSGFNDTHVVVVQSSASASCQPAIILVQNLSTLGVSGSVQSPNQGFASGEFILTVGSATIETLSLAANHKSMYAIEASGTGFNGTAGGSKFSCQGSFPAASNGCPKFGVDAVVSVLSPSTSVGCIISAE